MWLYFYSEIYVFCNFTVCYIDIVTPCVCFGSQLIISQQILFALGKHNSHIYVPLSANSVLRVPTFSPHILPQSY